MPSSDPFVRYTEACRSSANEIIRSYSTSFALAVRLLSRPTRPHVAAIYALARIADEIVDGAVAGSDAVGGDPRRLLADLRMQTDDAVARGYSTNPVVHAFADTARRFGIDSALTDPFFDSMAMDLEVRHHDAASLARYIHGSAEVVGEMCLLTFDSGSLADDELARAAARALGSAFQKVNFVRDVREDALDLGRNYLPGRDPLALTHLDIAELTDDVDADLAVARSGIERIPGRDAVAVWAAHDLFAALNERLRGAGPKKILAGRVRVPDRVKAAIVGRSLARTAVPA